MTYITVPYAGLYCGFFLCLARDLRLRAQVQIMRASANHWGWYGVLQVLIPTVLFLIFIVEDERSQREISCYNLEVYGYKVLIAENGE